MQGSFLPSLIACISEGRPPQTDDVAALSQKIWDEGLAFAASGSRDAAIALATVALSGGGLALRR